MRLPDEYYDLILDRDQLLEEIQDCVNPFEQMIIAYKINHLDKKIEEIEKSMRG